MTLFFFAYLKAQDTPQIHLMDIHLVAHNQEATHLHHTLQVVQGALDLAGPNIQATWEAHLKEVDPNLLLPHNLGKCMADLDGINLQAPMALDLHIQVLEVKEVPQQQQHQVQQIQHNLMEVSHLTQNSTRYDQQLSVTKNVVFSFKTMFWVCLCSTDLT